MALYKVVRFFASRNKPKYTVPSPTGLTLEQARKHCQGPEANSNTCTTKAGKARTAKYGLWFDGYAEE